MEKKKNKGKFEIELNENYKEILKLDKRMNEENIPHTMERLFDGYHISVPNQDINEIYLSIIETKMSYGSKFDLMEAMGYGIKDPAGVAGYINTDRAMELVKIAEKEFKNRNECAEKETE